MKYLKNLFVRSFLFSSFILITQFLFLVALFPNEKPGFYLFLAVVGVVGIATCGIISYYFLTRIDRDLQLVASLMAGVYNGRQPSFKTELIGLSLEKELRERAQIR